MSKITRIPWNNGEGYIVATYEGAGNGPLHFSSSVANEDVDRTQMVQVAATGNALDVDVTVHQTGLREPFCTADTGNPELNTSDDELLASLKA